MKHKLFIVGGALWLTTVCLSVIISLPIGSWLEAINASEGLIDIYAQRIKPFIASSSIISTSGAVGVVIFNLFKPKKVEKVSEKISEVSDLATINSQEVTLELIQGLFECVKQLSIQIAEIAKNKVTSVDQIPIDITEHVAKVQPVVDKLETLRLQVLSDSKSYDDRIKEALLHIDSAKHDQENATTNTEKEIAIKLQAWWNGILDNIEDLIKK